MLGALSCWYIPQRELLNETAFSRNKEHQKSRLRVYAAGILSRPLTNTHSLFTWYIYKKYKEPNTAALFAFAQLPPTTQKCGAWVNVVERDVCGRSHVFFLSRARTHTTPHAQVPTPTSLKWYIYFFSRRECVDHSEKVSLLINYAHLEFATAICQIYGTTFQSHTILMRFAAFARARPWCSVGASTRSVTAVVCMMNGWFNGACSAGTLQR